MKSSSLFLIILWVCLISMEAVGRSDSGDSVGQSGPARDICISVESEKLFSRGGAEFTFSEFDAILRARVPREDWVEFLSSPQRLARILDALYLNNFFLNRDGSPSVLGSPELNAELYVLVAQAVRDRMVREEVERSVLDDYEASAREIFLNERDQFTRRESVDFYHLLIPVKSVEAELAALSDVEQVAQFLNDREDFLDLEELQLSSVEMSSDNPNLFEEVDVETLLPEIKQQMESLGEGQMRGPIRTDHGWHFIQLVQRQSAEPMTWEEAKSMAEEIAEARHRTEIEQRIIQQLLDEPIEIVEGGVRQLLSRYGVTWSDDIGAAFN